MKPVLFLGVVLLMALFSCTSEVAIDKPSEEVKETGSKSDASDDVDWSSLGFYNKNADGTYRWNRSRMLGKTTTTTWNYEEWWFFTTRRPILSYKDYPGKPGVATWKEISPSSTTENRSSRKMKNPSAEEVSSSSWRFASDLRHSFVYAILGTLMGLYNIHQWVFTTLF